MEVLPQISVRVMLENTSILKVVTRISAGVLSKTNEFVKQVNILLIFIFSHCQFGRTLVKV